MVMTNWVNIKFIKCLFTGHDIEKIPKPINKDYGEISPGSVCIRCGRMYLKKEPPKKPDRIDKAKLFYEKLCTYESFSNSSYGTCLPPGPYCDPPTFDPKDD